MSKSVLNSLWDKICDVFVTRTCAAAIEVSKQDPLIAGRGIRIKDNVISNKLIPNDEEDFEEVVVSILSDIAANVSNKTLNVYYNGSLLPNETYTTDENGTCTFRVPYGYSYEVDFPVISGYLLITPEKHVATLMQRLIEVEYIPLPSIDDDDYGEEVKIKVIKHEEDNSFVNLERLNLSVKIGTASAVTKTTDENGEITFKVRYGTSYTVTAPNLTNYYMNSSSYTKTFTAEKTLRVINFVYYYLRVGIFIVDNQGNEYTLEEFVQARDVDLTVTNEDAVLIKVVNSTLAKFGGIFAIDIDMVREKTYNSIGYVWSSNIDFVNVYTNINISGNYYANDLSPYFYDGFSFSQVVQEEGKERGVSTPAFNYALSFSKTLSNGITLPGFLGSIGLWVIFLNNATAINNLLELVRPTADAPEGTTYYTLSLFRNGNTADANNYNKSTWIAGEKNSTTAFRTHSKTLITCDLHSTKSHKYLVFPFYAY